MSESSPSLEMTAPKVAPVATSFEKPNGKANFTPLPNSTSFKTKQDEYAALARQAIADSEAEIKRAKEKSQDKTETREIPPVKTAPSPSKPTPPLEMPAMPQLTSSQHAEAREELAGLKASKQGKPEDHAEVEKMLNDMEKQLNLTGNTAKQTVAPVEKRISSNVAAIKPDPVAKASAETKVESGSKQSLLTKIASIAEKIFSIPLAIIKAIWSWITK